MQQHPWEEGEEELFSDYAGSFITSEGETDTDDYDDNNDNDNDNGTDNDFIDDESRTERPAGDDGVLSRDGGRLGNQMGMKGSQKPSQPAYDSIVESGRRQPLTTTTKARAKAEASTGGNKRKRHDSDRGQTMGRGTLGCHGIETDTPAYAGTLRPLDRGDAHLQLQPITAPDSTDATVRTLGVTSSSQSTSSLEKSKAPFTYTRHEFRQHQVSHTAHEGRRGTGEGLSRGKKRSLAAGSLNAQSHSHSHRRRLCLAEGIWRKYEEIAGLIPAVGRGYLYAYDERGLEYKPELPIATMIRLVIAAFPRKQLTLSQELSQICLAIEERWPGLRDTNRKWRENSVRHSLSYHDCFVNVDRESVDGSGSKGKGGYWEVSSSEPKVGISKRRKSNIHSLTADPSVVSRSPNDQGPSATVADRPTLFSALATRPSTPASESDQIATKRPWTATTTIRQPRSSSSASAHSSAFTSRSGRMRSASAVVPRSTQPIPGLVKPSPFPAGPALRQVQPVIDDSASPTICASPNPA